VQAAESVKLLKRIDTACDRFEQAWLAGTRPRLEDFVAEAPSEDRPAFLHALSQIQQELVLSGIPVESTEIQFAAAPDDLSSGPHPAVLPEDVPRVTLTVTAGPHSGRRFDFDRHETLLAGRSTFAQLRLPDDVHFSRNHFRLEVNPPECFLIDLDSTNGTFVNGHRVRQQILKHGDVILVGDTEMTVTSLDAQATCQMAIPARPPQSMDRKDATDDRGAVVRTPWSGREKPNERHHSIEPTETPRPDQGVRTTNDRIPIVPGYRIENEVGWGDLGSTYRATRLSTGEPCALKVLTPADRMSERSVQLFLREAGVLNQLDHPHIVRMLDLGSANGMLYIATEFVPAVRWDAVMERATPEARIRTACGLICQVLDALNYAHTRSFVHRDIKPSNVLVRREGRRLIAKLSDFGLAKRYTDAGFSQLTRNDVVLGSLPYMSPEQFSDSRHAKPPCDIYSVGATLYRLVSGHDPFVFTKSRCKFLAILEDDPIPLPKSFPQVPSALADIVHRALAKEPDKRFCSAAEMRHALLPFGRRR